MASVPITLANSSSNIDPNFDVYLVDASNSNVTLTLPAITSDGTLFLFRRVDTASGNTVTLQGNSNSETIDGSLSLILDTLINNDSTIVSYGGVWIHI